jgi:hypothetical protein
MFKEQDYSKFPINMIKQTCDPRRVEGRVAAAGLNNLKDHP